MTLDGRPPRVRCAVRVLIARALPVIVVLLLAAGTTAGVAYSRGWSPLFLGQSTPSGVLACLGGVDGTPAVTDDTLLTRSVVTLPDLGPNGTITHAAVGPAGDVVLAGVRTVPSSQLLLYRIDRTGTAVASFGASGLATLNLPVERLELTDIHALADGSLVVVGNRREQDSSRERAGPLGWRVGVLIIRVTSSGEFDTAFGSGGMLSPVPDASYSQANASLIHSGLLYIAGEADRREADPLRVRSLVLSFSVDDQRVLALSNADLADGGGGLFISSLVMSPVYGLLAGVLREPYVFFGDGSFSPDGAEKAAVVSFSPDLARAELFAVLELTALPRPEHPGNPVYEDVQLAADGSRVFVATQLAQRSSPGRNEPSRNAGLAIGDSAELVGSPGQIARLSLAPLPMPGCNVTLGGILVLDSRLLLGTSVWPSSERDRPRYQSTILVSQTTAARPAFDRAIAIPADTGRSLIRRLAGHDGLAVWVSSYGTPFNPRPQTDLSVILLASP